MPIHFTVATTLPAAQVLESQLIAEIAGKIPSILAEVEAHKCMASLGRGRLRRLAG